MQIRVADVYGDLQTKDYFTDMGNTFRGRLNSEVRVTAHTRTDVCSQQLIASLCSHKKYGNSRCKVDSQMHKICHHDGLELFLVTLAAASLQVVFEGVW